MILSILGIVIGFFILVAGVYYLIKEKDDKESGKIYGTAVTAGLVVMVVSALMLML